MKPKISIVGLGVTDLTRAVAFYRDGLGFPTHNYAEGDDYILFALEGTWLALHPRSAAASDLPPGSGASSLTWLSHNAPSKAGVDEVFQQGLAAGATALTPPREAPWGGYEASFADPDGHVWDIAYNPFTDLT
jgi:catechol 2,3-dioxygenase-like lactoylglutathione lyase family enzyme